MKLWASATAIGFSVFGVLQACSSPPTDSYQTPPGSGNTGNSTSQGGSGNATSQGGSGNATSQGGSGNATSQGGSGNATSQGGSGNATSQGGSGTAGTSTGTGGMTSGGSEGPCPAGVVGHCDAGATYPTYPGVTLALVEDFPAPIDLDSDPIFTWSDGSPANGQTRFRKEQITFANGKMIITAQNPTGCPVSTGNPNGNGKNAACIPPGTSYAEPAKGSNTGMTYGMGVWSGEFRTKYNNYRYGRYEAKFHAPTANPDITMGDFLSTLFVFRTPKWNVWNELDFELEPTISTSVAGNAISVAGRTDYPSDANDAWTSTMNLPGGYKNTDEHVYAIDWEPNMVTWYVDGQVVQTFAGKANDPVPNLSAKIMMNLWVFDGNAFGLGQNNKYPFSSEYEYFRYYKSSQETKYPCSPTPSCLSADDLADSQNNPTEMNYGK